MGVWVRWRGLAMRGCGGGEGVWDRVQDAHIQLQRVCMCVCVCARVCVCVCARSHLGSSHVRVFG